MTEYIVKCREFVGITGKTLQLPDYIDMNQEIVRCRDCYFGKEVHWPAGSDTPSDWLDCVGPMVETWDYWNDEPQDNPVPPYGFCFWAERRDA